MWKVSESPLRSSSLQAEAKSRGTRKKVMEFIITRSEGKDACIPRRLGREDHISSCFILI